MRRYLLVFLSLVLVTTMVTAQEDIYTKHPCTEVYDGWKLGVQTWSFRLFTLFESIDKTRSLGLNYIQAYPGQKVSDTIDAGFGANLTKEQKEQVKAKLDEAGIKIFAFGVVGMPEDEAGARKLFEFAKEMNIPTLVSEPKESQFDLVDKLCQEYKIKLAIHNHPKPSHYWDPDTVLNACKGRSEWIGSCADVGHWVRGGMDPVECLKKLEGRIIDVHIKEIDVDHDVVWGTGQGRIKGILEELHRQGFKGSFSIEYEYNWENSVPEIRQSIEYFNSIASNLKPTGWKPLFKNDLSDADIAKNNWAVENGELVLKDPKFGDIWTKAKYENFVLDLEYKLEKGSNSGVFLRTQNHSWLPWIEIQVIDCFGKGADKHSGGAVYDVMAPSVNAVKAVGQWNRMSVTAKDSRICVVLNGVCVADIDLNNWPEAHKNPDETKNKFDIAYKDLPRSGFIGFQDHGVRVSYRNVRIKEL